MAAGPLFVASARNVLSNLRCIGYSRTMNERFGEPENTLSYVTVEDERLGRPYHVVMYGNGRYSVGEFQPDGALSDPQPQLDGVEWLVSGTPVCWDCGEEELFQRMITDAAHFVEALFDLILGECLAAQILQACHDLAPGEALEVAFLCRLCLS